MGLLDSQIISLNKSRQRAVFWRQDSTGNWVQTTPLPADQASIRYYFLKGFKAKPPDDKSEGFVLQEKDSDVQCPFCGDVCRGVAGLKHHLAIHKETKKEET